MGSKERCVIFDLDGVLFASEKHHGEAYRAMFATRGITEFRYAAYAGVRTDETVRRVLTEAQLPFDEDLVAACVAEKRALAKAALTAAPPVVAAAPRVLRTLSAQYRLFIATSASRSTLEIFLDASNTRDVFQGWLSGEDVVRGKPAPEIYETALARLECRARDAVVIEDAPEGIRAAIAAGIPTIGVVGTVSEQALREAGAFAVVGSLDELPAAIR